MKRFGAGELREKARALLRQEEGGVVKPRGGRMSVALVYPNSYYVGMSNLGFQAVYRLINGREDALAERAFLPDEDVRDDYERTGTPLFALESQTPVSEFDVVAFSVSFENDYVNVAKALSLSGLPPLRRDRDDAHPLVIMGGICAFFNPEPVADFFDVVAVGEAEALLPGLFDCLISKGHLSRRVLLLELAKLPGIYIPAFYTPEYLPDGRLAGFTPAEGAPEKIRRTALARLDDCPAGSVILTPNTEFSSMYMSEISRGCGRQCRFCMAGYIYRPVRHRDFDSVKDEIAGAAGRKKIGLVGAAVSDYPGIGPLACEFSGSGINFSASSLRADSLTPEVVALVSKGNRTVAIAPEAGSDRLRAFINKNITEDQIIGAVRMLIDGGVLNVRLYFMVGLPTETDEDVDAITELAKKARQAQLDSARKKGRMGSLTLSVNCFIPKPWTPFQWEAMEAAGPLNGKIKRIKSVLKGIPNLNVINDVPKYAYLQAALSRGDRRLSDVILSAARAGGDFSRAFGEHGLTMEFFARRTRAEDEVFPWDFIDEGVKKEYLWRERGRAYEGKPTPPCRPDICRACGACREVQADD